MREDLWEEKNYILTNNTASGPRVAAYFFCATALGLIALVEMPMTWPAVPV